MIEDSFGGAFRLMEQGSDVDGYMRLAKRNMQLAITPLFFPVTLF